MKKLKLSLDDLQVSSFRTAAGAPASGGTVKANSGCVADGSTAYWSTCDPSGGASCDACPSANTDCGGMLLYTYEASYCVCSDQCEFSEFSNCHRC